MTRQGKKFEVKVNAGFAIFALLLLYPLSSNLLWCCLAFYLIS